MTKESMSMIRKLLRLIEILDSEEHFLGIHEIGQAINHIRAQDARIEALEEEVNSLATTAYEAAEPVPMSKERIDEMVDYVVKKGN